MPVDLSAPGDPSQWTGLEFEVTGAARPRLRVEYSRRRFRVCNGEETRLLARLEDWYRGLWWARASASGSLLAPLRASDARDRSRDERGWAWTFHQLLGGASVLYPGTWRIEPPPRHEASFGGYSVVRRLETCLEASSGYSRWTMHGSGDVFALRAASAEGAGRVKAWRKVAREGLLPPVLLYFVSGMDSWLVLDGHDRLLAARLEGVKSTALTLSSIRTHAWTPDLEARARMQVGIERQLELGSDAARVHSINQRLIEMYADPLQVMPRTRVWPLRDWQGDAERLVRDGAPPRLRG